MLVRLTDGSDPDDHVVDICIRDGIEANNHDYFNLENIKIENSNKGVDVNWLQDDGFILEEFEDFTDWTVII